MRVQLFTEVPLAFAPRLMAGHVLPRRWAVELKALKGGARRRRRRRASHVLGVAARSP